MQYPMAMLLCSVQFEFCGRFFSAGIPVLARELVSRTIAVTKFHSEFKNGMTASHFVDLAVGIVAAFTLIYSDSTSAER